MKYKRIITGICVIVISLFSIFTLLSGCNNKVNYVTDINQLNDSKYTITVDPGSVAAQDAKKTFPNAKFLYNTTADSYLAVSQGIADAFVCGKVQMQYAIASDSLNDLIILDGVLNRAEVAAGINPKRADLAQGINSFFAEIKLDGTFDDMYNRWVVTADDTMPQIPKATNPTKTIRFGTSGQLVPLNYYGDNRELVGLDIELIKRLALYLNVDYTIETMGFDALISSLQSDRLDVVLSDLNVTEERKENIIFSEPYMFSETAVLVRKKTKSDEVVTSIDQLNGKTIGCAQGASYIPEIKKKYPDSAINEYNGYADMVMALKSKRIDAYISDEPMVRAQIKDIEGISFINELITHDRYGFMLNLNSVSLCADINTVIADLTQDGTLTTLREKWVLSNDEVSFDVSQPWDKPNGTLKVGFVNDACPFSYYYEEGVVGYDVELTYMIAERLGYGVELSPCDINDVINGVVSDKLDLAIGCMTYTPERAETMLFTDATYNSGTVAVIYSETVMQKGFFQKLGESFEKTFIRENRWKMILNGLLITLEISILTLVFGSLLGFGFSFLIRSKNKVVSKIFSAISKAIDGLPLLIILMVFYYIIFAKTPLSAIAIGVIGLSIDFANTVAGILNTGVDGVDKGQIEAAESMGYPKWKIFLKITFPQAAIQMFSQYVGSVVAMIKGTSIIGYITVIDLTKAGDIIRGLTYEAFFPLIAIALIYFLFAQLIAFLLKLIEKNIDPKRRKRQVRGVKTHD